MLFDRLYRSLFVLVFGIAVNIGGVANVAHGAGDKSIDYDKRYLAFNLPDEPKSLDPQLANDNIANMILAHINEGLTRLDASGKPFPAVAEKWTTEGGKIYTFTIRADAKWSDGKPVRAQDFLFGWQRALDPKLSAQYASMLFRIKNAEEINAGKLPMSKLGVKVIDDRTLRVELKNPTSYFLTLLSFSTFYPARSDFVSKHGTQYASNTETLLSNGPFLVSSWKHNSSIKLQKNPSYWNRDKIWLNTIDMPYLIRDQSTEFNMFKDRKFAFVWRIAKEQLPAAQSGKMQIRRFNSGIVWYLRLNTTRPPMSNAKFRKALQIGIDRDEFARSVQGLPGATGAVGIIPSYMPGFERTYGEEYPINFKDSRHEEAKKLLAEAKKELGLESFGTIKILASDTANARRDMEYFQRYFKEKLGLEVELDFQAFKTRLERTSKLDFDIVNSGWGPDYLDAMTFADLFTSWNANNNTGWSSKTYDNHIKTAMEATDPKRRLDHMHSANELLIEEVPVIPYLEESAVYVQDPRLIGIIRRAVSPDIDFYFARLKKSSKK